MLINFHELFNEGKERISIESLPTGESANARVTLKNTNYREGKPRRARVHTFHVHVGAEKRYFTVFISVRLHTLEKCLSILQDN